MSIIIPAHNEARVIGRLLTQLVSDASPDEFDVIVVANGCTDNTADVAAAYGPSVRVLSIPVASKREALLAGNREAGGFPRIYADADVELGAADVRLLSAALRRPGVFAAAPERSLTLTDRTWLIRWYYDVWTRLPEVKRGLFGRGVVAVSEEGYQRIAQLPPVLADDLAASLAFAPQERAIATDATVLIHPPRTAMDLLRRRVRAAVTVAQFEWAQTQEAPATGVEALPDASARTRPADLIEIARNGPGMAARVAVFMAVAMAARTWAHRAVSRRDYSTWHRDESSRDQ